MRRAALLLGLLIAAPAAGQQSVIRCRNTTVPIPPAQAARPVVQPGLKMHGDSLLCIAANGTANTNLRNREALHFDSIARVKVDTVFIFVPVDTLPPIELPPEDTVPIPPGEKVDTLSGNRVGDVRCPMFGRCFVSQLTIDRGSLLVESAVLVMRPGSTLTFTGQCSYVGGGMQWLPEWAGKECGLWVWGSGRLDVAGTPKTAWSRAPVSDWSTTDEYWIAPTNVGDYAPRRWALGQPIPRADPSMPSAEVVNATRDVVIQGGHVHIHSTASQRVEYTTLRGCGIPGVLGRYCAHLHVMGEAARGSVIQGVLCVDAKAQCFVPHMSDGVQMADNVCLNVQAQCLWWDQAHPTHDLMADRFGALGVRGNAYVLDAGTGNEMRNSWAAAASGNGFNWPEPTPNYDAVLTQLIWKFDAGNVAHNNAEPGLSFWNNEQAVQTESHIVANYTSYRNLQAISNGAYVNCNQYQNVTSFEDGVGSWYAGMLQPAVSWGARSGECGGTRSARLEDSRLRAKDGPALVLGVGAVKATTYMAIEDLVLTPGPGQPKVLVTEPAETTQPGKWHFIRSGVTPTDIVFRSCSGGNNGSEILIDHEDGRKWRVWCEGGQKKVSNR